MGNYLGDLIFGAVTNPTVKDLPHVDPSSGLFQTGVNVFFGVIGAVCLLIVTIQGFKIVLSRGSPQDIAKARNAIIYALLGLVVSLSAVAIVNFVVGNIG